MDIRVITEEEAASIVERGESLFWDDKSARSNGAVVQKIAVAFANTDGGEFAIGIEDAKVATGMSRWAGFRSIEESNHVHQALTSDVSPPVPFSYEYLQVIGRESQGLVCLIRVEKRRRPTFHSSQQVLRAPCGQFKRNLRPADH